MFRKSKNIISIATSGAENSIDFTHTIMVLEKIASAQDHKNNLTVFVHCNYVPKTDNASEVVRFLEKGTLKSAYYLLRSSIYIITHGVRDAGAVFNFRSKIINIWHGAPIKKIGLDSGLSEANLSTISMTKLWDFFVVPSVYWRSQFKRAYGFPENKIVDIGYPRHEYLNNHRRLKRSSAHYSSRKKIIYAPTYRAGIVDGDIFKIFRNAQFESYIKKNNIEFIFKSHPLDGLVELSDGVVDGSTRCLEFELLSCDLLISDCSSVIYDAAVAGVETMLFFPDFEEFREVVGGFYNDFPHSEFLNGNMYRDIFVLLEDYKNKVGLVDFDLNSGYLGLDFSQGFECLINEILND